MTKTTEVKNQNNQQPTVEKLEGFKQLANLYDVKLILIKSGCNDNLVLTLEEVIKEKLKLVGY